MAADGTGQPARVTTSTTNHFPQSWSGDGETLVIMAGIPADLQVVSIGADSPPQDLIATEVTEVNAEVSPDGRWMAYMSNESGRTEVYVRQFPDVDDGKWQISRDGGASCSFGRQVVVTCWWSPWTRSRSLVLGNPEVLFEAPYRSSAPGRGRPWDVAADGRFLMIKESGSGQEASGPAQINVVLNWAEELKRLAPVP